jgi:hypothetical protein
VVINTDIRLLIKINYGLKLGRESLAGWKIISFGKGGGVLGSPIKDRYNWGWNAVIEYIGLNRGLKL